METYSERVQVCLWVVFHPVMGFELLEENCVGVERSASYDSNVLQSHRPSRRLARYQHYQKQQRRLPKYFEMINSIQ